MTSWLLLAASYGDIPRMAFARRTVAESAGLKSSFVTSFQDLWFKTRDTQTIHRASVPLYSLLLFTGHYGATGAL